MVDGLKGFPEAISAVLPMAQVQTCVVHSLFDAVCLVKERKAVAAALKPVYRAETAERARESLQEFEAGAWGKKYPAGPRPCGSASARTVCAMNSQSSSSPLGRCAVDFMCIGTTLRLPFSTQRPVDRDRGQRTRRSSALPDVPITVDVGYPEVITFSGTGSLHLRKRRARSSIGSTRTGRRRSRRPQSPKS